MNVHRDGHGTDVAGPIHHNWPTGPIYNLTLSEFTTEEAPDDQACILDATKSAIMINIYLMLGAPK